MEHNVDSALAFLREIRPEGPWNLAAIRVEPVKGGSNCAESVARNEVDLAGFLEEYADRNIYFTANPIKGRRSKENVTALSYCHVDVDPPACDSAEALVEARAEILGRLEAFTPRATAVWSSGGGYQAVWRLDEMLSMAEVEERNCGLIEALGGDVGTHDCSRLMRLPGTVNWPDRKKVAKGRVVARAESVWIDQKQAVGGEELPVGCHTPGKGELRTGGAKERRGGDVKGVSRGAVGGKRGKRGARGGAGGGKDAAGGIVVVLPDALEEVDLFDMDLPEYLTHALFKGELDGDEDRWRGEDGVVDRSGVLAWCLIELVNHGLVDAVIAGVVMVPGTLTRAHVDDQNPGWKVYLERQISRTREWLRDKSGVYPAGEATLEMMNGLYACVTERNVRGQPMNVLEMGKADQGDYRTQAVKNFKELLANKRVKVGVTKEGLPKYQNLAAWWVAHPDRRYYDDIVFDPRDRCGDDVINTWKGLAVEPREDPEAMAPIMEHLKDIICDGKPELFEYLIRWSAFVVQRPWEPVGACVVLKGLPGAGKGAFADFFCKVFGQHAQHVKRVDEIVGQFNHRQERCVFMFCDEVHWTDNKHAEGRLKGMITDNTLEIRAHYEGTRQVTNHLSLLFASNEKKVVPVGISDRRYLVLEVSEKMVRNQKYYKRLWDCLGEQAVTAGPGVPAFLDYLLKVDLSGWHSEFNMPVSKGTQAEAASSLDPIEEVMLSWAQEGVLPFDEQDIVGEADVDGRALYAKLKHHPKIRNWSDTKIGLDLHDFMKRVYVENDIPLIPVRGVMRTKRMSSGTTYWVFPPLAAMRDTFSKTYKLYIEDAEVGRQWTHETNFVEEGVGSAEVEAGEPHEEDEEEDWLE